MKVTLDRHQCHSAVDGFEARMRLYANWKRSSEMKTVFPLLAALAFIAAPALAADDEKKESTEQSATEEKDRAPVKKAIGVKAIDKVGNDGIVEKGAKVRVLRK
jgi:hypothetical protein